MQRNHGKSGREKDGRLSGVAFVPEKAIPVRLPSNVPDVAYAQLAIAILGQAKADAEFIHRLDEGKPTKSMKISNRASDVRRTYDPIKYLKSDNPAQQYLHAVGIATGCIDNWVETLTIAEGDR